MKKTIILFLLGMISVSLFFSCANDAIPEEIAGQKIPVDDMAILNSLGFAESSIEDMGDYYLAEGDIAIPKENLQTYVGTRQAYTNIVVSVGRADNIKVKIDNSIKNLSNWQEAILTAINHYNNIGSGLYFNIVENDSDITISYEGLSDYYGFPLSNVLAESSFPKGNGIAGPTIKINSYFNYNGTTAVNISLNQKIWTIAHELCHNIGFRHTDYLISDPPTSSFGANHVSGTPTGTSNNPDPNSVFNSGPYFGNDFPPSWNRFSYYDLKAINYVYPSPEINASSVTAVGDHVQYTLDHFSYDNNVLQTKWEVNGVLQSAYSPFTPNFNQPGTYTVKCTVTYQDRPSLIREKEVKVFPNMNNGQIYVFNHEIVTDGNDKYVEYDIAGKLGLYGFSMSNPIYILFLPRGVWDIYPTDYWDWQYVYGQYSLPKGMGLGFSHWTSSLGSQYGSIITIRIRQPVAASVNSPSETSRSPAPRWSTR